jgi:hypothetical protein
LEQELFVLYLLAIGCGGCEAEQRKKKKKPLNKSFSPFD